MAAVLSGVLFQRIREFFGRPVFSPRRYWEDRHQAFAGTLAAVGHARLSDEANAEQYTIKSERIAAMIRRCHDGESGDALLDAGCGVGMLTPLYMEMGFIVMGVDFSETAIAQARLRCPAAAFHSADLARLQLRRAFDVIVVADVLQHIIDDHRFRATLERLREHMKKDGCLIVLDSFSVPNEKSAPHCNRRTLDHFELELRSLGLRMTHHESFRLRHENAIKDLLAVRRIASESLTSESVVNSRTCR